MLYSAEEKAVGGMLTGINPAKEEKLSRLKESLKEGEYLTNADQNQLYIGNELAKRLGVKLGDTLSYIGTGADYSFAADNLTIKGIFQTGLFNFDASSAFINGQYFDKIMAADNMATHFIVLPKNQSNSKQLAAAIGGKISIATAGSCGLPSHARRTPGNSFFLPRGDLSTAHWKSGAGAYCSAVRQCRHASSAKGRSK